MRRVRRGGRFGEKMLTLTIPHNLLSQAWGVVKREASGFLENDLAARVVALFEAWTRFLKRFNRHWRAKCRREAGRHVVYHRAFEWTPGKQDDHGHPHFHVYLWCPWVDEKLIHLWWAESLEDVGWPVEWRADHTPIVSTRIQALRSNGISEVRELLKGGDRKALTLSRVEFQRPDEGKALRRGYRKGEPGIDAFSYAEGWTLGDVKDCSDEVRARLYKALEGRRLTQASRGFFLDDEPLACECCGAVGMFRPRFEVPKDRTVAAVVPIRHETGPP